MIYLFTISILLLVTFLWYFIFYFWNSLKWKNLKILLITSIIAIIAGIILALIIQNSNNNVQFNNEESFITN